MDFSHSPLLMWLDHTLNKALIYKKYVIAVAIGLCVVASSIVVYQLYGHHRNVRAHKEMIEALKVYEASVVPNAQPHTNDSFWQFPTEEEKWKNVSDVFAQGYEKNKGAGIAPFFLTVQAEALARLGKLDDAVKVMDRALYELPSKEMQAIYKVKFALIKLDSTQAAYQKQGLSELIALAGDDKGFAHEHALYHTGMYFWCKKDFAQAKNYWQQLMLKYGYKDVKNQSGFADLVKTKLGLISSEFQ
ncbi:MAG: hypothetical protein WCT20_00460 [Candidatus Babeliales bacterium]